MSSYKYLSSVGFDQVFRKGNGPKELPSGPPPEVEILKASITDGSPGEIRINTEMNIADEFFFDIAGQFTVPTGFCTGPYPVSAEDAATQIAARVTLFGGGSVYTGAAVGNVIFVSKSLGGDGTIENLSLTRGTGLC